VLALAGVVAAAGRPAWRRRRRRRRRTPAGRVAGAWQETISQLRRVGLRPAPNLTAGDVADLGVGAVGANAEVTLRALAELANRAGFGPGPAAELDAVAAWRYCDTLAALVGRTRRRR
jgi:hypothetical protein